MAIMSNTDTKKVKVTPSNLQSIPDILPENKRIEKEVTMELNPNEIKRCMSFGTVKEVRKTGEVNLDPTNFNQKEETANTDSTDVIDGKADKTPASDVNNSQTDKETADAADDEQDE